MFEHFCSLVLFSFYFVLILLLFTLWGKPCTNQMERNKVNLPCNVQTNEHVTILLQLEFHAMHRNKCLYKWNNKKIRRRRRRKRRKKRGSTIWLADFRIVIRYRNFGQSYLYHTNANIISYNFVLFFFYVCAATSFIFWKPSNYIPASRLEFAFALTLFSCWAHMVRRVFASPHPMFFAGSNVWTWSLKSQRLECQWIAYLSAHKSIQTRFTCAHHISQCATHSVERSQ